VSVFKEYPALRVEISGHTSDEGKRDFNMKLSRKRAEAVKLFLVSRASTRAASARKATDPTSRSRTTRPRREGEEPSHRVPSARDEEKVQTQPEPEDINPAPIATAR